MSPTFTDDDIGKPVETAEGEQLAVVADIDPETAYVEPAPGTTDSTKAVLDWEERGEEAIPLTDDAVTEITDDAIRLEDEFQTESIASGTTAEEDRSGESDESATETGQADVDHAPGEPVASNPTDVATDVDGTDDDPGTSTEGLDDSEPMMEDDGFYDTAEGDARVDPDDEMEPPEETAAAEAAESAESTDGTEGATGDEQESTDRDDVNVDPDEVTEGDPEAEINAEEDVGRRRGPE